MNNIYVEYATGREHTVCTQHSDELLEPCWWKGQTTAPCEQCDVTALAEEIAAVEGLCPIGAYFSWSSSRCGPQQRHHRCLQFHKPRP